MTDSPDPVQPTHQPWSEWWKQTHPAPTTVKAFIENDKGQFESLEFDDWLRYGLERGWNGPPVCSTHDGIPTSEAEDDEFEEGDPCIHVIRLYEDLEVRDAVLANHGPSNWRDLRPAAER